MPYYWILDPKRTKMQTLIPPLENNVIIFQNRIIDLREEIGRKAVQLTKEKIIQNFQDNGYQIDGQNMDQFNRDVKKFIESRAMTAAFKKDPRTPFAILMKLVHSLQSPSEQREWLQRPLLEWLRTRPVGLNFDIDMEARSNRANGQVHSVFSTAAKLAGPVFDFVKSCEATALGATLRVKLPKKGDKILQDHRLVRISLGPHAIFGARVLIC